MQGNWLWLCQGVRGGEEQGTSDMRYNKVERGRQKRKCKQMLHVKNNYLFFGGDELDTSKAQIQK